jgi:hypothetical protein
MKHSEQTMRWEKKGIIFAPDSSLGAWAQSHAMIPTPVLIAPDCLRIYSTMCDADGIGRPGFVDVAPEDPTHILGVSETPLLDVGIPGTFDENGVLTCSVVPTVSGEYLMYYVGFELGHKIRYRLLSGLAVSKDGGNTFERVSKTPVLERSDTELFFRGGPFALEEGGTIRLWYVAGSEWTQLAGKSMPVYDMRYLESEDGYTFSASGRLVMALTDPDEHGFGRPWVVKRGEADYQLFFSVRKRSLGAYRLGYAESTDGIQWVRKDHLLNLDISVDGFDNRAIMYAAVISVAGKTYCFYNGNDFGRDGIALAELITA